MRQCDTGIWRGRAPLRNRAAAPRHHIGEHVPGDIGVGVTCGTMATHARPDRPNAGDDARPGFMIDPVDDE